MLLRLLGYNKLLNANGQYDTCNATRASSDLHMNVKRFSQPLSIFRTYPVLGSQKILLVTLREHPSFSALVPRTLDALAACLGSILKIVIDPAYA